MDAARHRKLRHPFPFDPRWQTVRAGIVLVQLSLLILYLASLTLLIDLTVGHPAFPARRAANVLGPVSLAAVFVGLAGLACGLIGIALWCAAPCERWLCNYARIGMVLLMLAMAAGVGVALPGGNRAIDDVAKALMALGGVCLGYAGVILCVLFLEGVAAIFEREPLARQVRLFLVTAIALGNVNFMTFVPAFYADATSTQRHLWLALPLIIPTLLWVWLIVLISGVRKAIVTSQQ